MVWCYFPHDNGEKKKKEGGRSRVTQRNTAKKWGVWLLQTKLVSTKLGWDILLPLLPLASLTKRKTKFLKVSNAREVPIAQQVFFFFLFSLKKVRGISKDLI